MARTFKVAFIGVSLAALVGGAVSLGLTRERDTVKLTDDRATPRSKPLIDASAPVRAEIATFSLG